MNAAHFARRFDRRLRRRPYRAVGDGVVLPREELRRIGASDGCARLATRAVGSLADGRRLGQPPTTLLLVALLALVWRVLLLAMHGSDAARLWRACLREAMQVCAFFFVAGAG